MISAGLESLKWWLMQLVINRAASTEALPDSQGMTKVVKDYSLYLNQLIGEGGYSSVYRGRSNTTGQAVAIKVISKGSLSPEDYQNIRQEFYILERLPPHPNIIKLVDLLETASSFYIVTQLCDFPLDKVQNLDNTAVALGIIEGLKHLYLNNVVHHDLKPANILMKNGIPKIIDFGLSRIVFEPHEPISESYGTTRYMAPELWEDAYHTSKCDIWSLGVTLHQLVYKASPYNAINKSDLKRKITLTLPPTLIRRSNDPLDNIIRRCLVPDKNRRISWQQLFALADRLKMRKSEVMLPANRPQPRITRLGPIVSAQVLTQKVPITHY